MMRVLPSSNAMLTTVLQCMFNGAFGKAFGKRFCNACLDHNPAGFKRVVNHEW